MEEKKLCVICNKWFGNGKALGGHMRAHFAKFPLPPKPNPDPDPIPMSQPVLPGADPNGSRVLRARNRAFSFSESMVYDIDTDTDSESPKHVTRRRSKRGRRVLDPTPSEEDIGAMSLIMLSRDSWSRKGGEARDEPANNVVAGVDVEDDTCNKSSDVSKTGESDTDLVNVVVEYSGKPCGCPFCNEYIFESLNKVHTSTRHVNAVAKTNTTGTSTSTGGERKKSSRNMIDLNSLPEPEEDDDM